jgi:AraC-like DNA-binding protein
VRRAALYEADDCEGGRMPRLLRSLIEGDSPPCLERRLPFAVKRSIGDLTAAPASIKFASLFYRAKCNEILWHILNDCDEEADIDDRPIGKSLLSKIEAVRKLIEEDPVRKYDIDELGRLHGMNRTKLRALFKAAYGATLSDYRMALLMRRADDMISETELAITEIGFRLGYSDASSFNVAYKRFYGQAPGWLRRR